MFYGYDQNNSGGTYSTPIIQLWVEADSPQEADQLAQRHGVYFDGVDLGLDCECCGDRWSRASKWFTKESVTAGEQAEYLRDWWGGRGLQVMVSTRPAYFNPLRPRSAPGTTVATI